jgi:outer membrane protein assembly factor BamD
MKLKYTWLLGVVILSSLLLIGCAGKKKVQQVPKDPAVLYTKATILFNKGEYKKAEEIFTQLKNYFPSDEIYALKADIRIADCAFFRKEYPEAIARYTEFKKRNPFHQEIPYVEFQIGLCYYKQILSKDRDREATVKALTVFQNVTSNYPNTLFGVKAREKITFCRRMLAEHELYVANFYRRKGEYPAAIKRCSLILERYPNSGIGDEALYILSIALHKQKRDPEALISLTRLVEEYPHSPFTKKGEKLLVNLKEEGVVVASPVHEDEKRIPQSLAKITQGVEFPFRITARSTEAISEKNAIMYTGEVVAFGKEAVIRSESLILTKDKEGVPKEMVAMGEVRVRGGGKEIFCKKAVWSPTNQLLIMTGDAKIRGAAEWTRGDEITLHLDTGRIEIKGETVEKMEEIERK